MSVLDLLRQRSRWVSLSMAMSMSVSMGASMTGCMGDPSADDGTEQATDDVTDVSHTAVRRQSIGNCWLYATVGWYESIQRRVTSTDLNVSESYLTYWDWYNKVYSGDFEGTGASLEIQTGGHWGQGANLLITRGIVSEGDFIPEEAAVEMSAAQSRALAALNTSLRTGALSTSTARRDRALIRRELNTAFGLRPEVIAHLDRIFGVDGTRALSSATDTVLGGFARKASSMSGGTVRTRSGSTRAVTMAELMGTSRNTWNPDQRTGAYAWTGYSYPSTAAARVTLLRRVQRALNDGQPVVVSWLVDFNALDSDGGFRLSELTTRMAGRQGGHLTVMEDYEVNNVPQLGTLGLGPLSPEQRTAALQGTLTRFRIKNSWGASRPDRASANGYYDLWMDYLNGPIQWRQGEATPPSQASFSPRTPLSSFVLPPGY